MRINEGVCRVDLVFQEGYNRDFRVFENTY